MASESKDSDSDILSLVGGGDPRGRFLFIAIAVLSGVLLLAIRQQTEIGSKTGGWWNEPALGPAVSLSLTFCFSVAASVLASKGQRDGDHRTVILCLLVAAAFLAAIWLIRVTGYGLAVLLFALFCGVVAGFRGKRLLQVSFGITLLMVLIFRIALGLWFPPALLFKTVPLLAPFGQYL